MAEKDAGWVAEREFFFKGRSGFCISPTHGRSVNRQQLSLIHQGSSSQTGLAPLTHGGEVDVTSNVCSILWLMTKSVIFNIIKVLVLYAYSRHQAVLRWIQWFPGRFAQNPSILLSLAASLIFSLVFQWLFLTFFSHVSYFPQSFAQLLSRLQYGIIHENELFQWFNESEPRFAYSDCIDTVIFHITVKNDNEGIYYTEHSFFVT